MNLHTRVITAIFPDPSGQQGYVVTAVPAFVDLPAWTRTPTNAAGIIEHQYVHFD